MINQILHLARVAHSVVRESLIKPTTRSDRWPTVRKHYLSLHPKCAACGGSTLLQVHHEKPFHDDPTLELDLNNLITLCMGKTECHLMIGHGGSFKQYNPNVVADALAAAANPNNFTQIAAKAEAARKPNQPGM